MAQSQKRNTKPLTAKRAVKERVIADGQAGRRNHRAMPGLVEHTKNTWSFLWGCRSLNVRLLMIMWLVFVLMVGVSQQAEYLVNRESARIYSESVAQGGTQALVEAGIVAATLATGGINTALTEVQGLMIGLGYVVFILVALWVARHSAADTGLSVRDGFYNGMGPIVPFTGVAVVGLLQMLPLAIASVIYTAAAPVLLTTLWFWPLAIALLLLGVATFFWLIRTVFALVITTIPGTYPVVALRSARELVSGLRAPIALRLLWLIGLAGVLFCFCIAIALGFDWLGAGVLVASLVQLSVLALLLYSINYIYLLYRRLLGVQD